MKKNIFTYIILGSLTCMGMSSCSNNLELSPISNYSDAVYWKTADQFDSFVVGLHARFRTHERSFLFLGELRSGTFGNDPGTTASFTGEASQGIERMWQHNLDMDNPGVSNFGGLYDQINQLNLLISKLNISTVLSEDSKNYYLGIAHGMRAFYYFQLYRSWGDAVIQTDAIDKIDVSNLAKEASPAAEVLKLIKSDIESSNAGFGTDYSIRQARSFWSKGATLMLQAEVYLWSAHREGGKQDATIAKNALTDIKSNLSLGLQPDFKNVFDVKSNGNNEMILGIRHKLNEASLGFISDFVPNANILVNFYDSLSNRSFSVTQDNYGGILRVPTRINTYRNYHDLDERKNSSIQAAYSKDDVGNYKIAGCFLYKYQGEQNAGSRAYSNDFPIYRYADLLLLMAEAKVILGESPKEEINQVRARAFGSHYQESIFGYPNQIIDKDPVEAILNERKLEFLAEGKYWYDLRRFGDKYVFAHTGLSSQEAYKLLWPIDRKSLTNNRALKQTAGYPQF
ncbi:carbohydrate-binding protein SusD [Sphingobacterium sp. ML3W]|uniref:SusD family outer membrane lipoprotein NanU n=1 Tax=Sphingobacterium sp. ML3W TaxID=1538644 RepID=UPI0004F6C400|nr:SusD family outer membrane lipoprotein NanU [Sphingobacterium sp. ML3W]AIM37665.1 carbohydrate-binding protein SusD [Sphingobacterium sp. ML3W]